METLTRQEQQELFERLKPTLLKLHACCGIIFNDDESNGGAYLKGTLGTVTFVKINEVEGFITNYHVYIVLRQNPKTILVHNKIEYPINLPDVEAYSQEDALDYVWVPLKKLKGFYSKSILFFNSDHFQRTEEYMYEKYGNLNTGDALNIIMNGTPNFGNFYDDFSKIQELVLTPMMPSIRRFDTVFLSSQIALQFDADKLLVFDDKLQRKFFEELQKDSEELQKDKVGIAFGGYSGGPVCAVGNDGYFLVGIIKQCKKFDHIYNILASPITIIAEDIENKSSK